MTLTLQGADQFDIESTPQRLPQKHVVAVRITSENASDGFKPTAGRVDEVGLADVPAPVWDVLICTRSLLALLDLSLCHFSLKQHRGVAYITHWAWYRQPTALAPCCPPG